MLRGSFALGHMPKGWGTNVFISWGNSWIQKKAHFGPLLSAIPFAIQSRYGGCPPGALKDVLAWLTNVWDPILFSQAVPPEELDYYQMWDALAQWGKGLTKGAQKEMLVGFNDVLDGTHTFVEIMAPLVKTSRRGRPKGRQGFPLKTTKREPFAFEEVEEALSKQGEKGSKGRVVGQ